MTTVVLGTKCQGLGRCKASPPLANQPAWLPGVGHGNNEFHYSPAGSSAPCSGRFLNSFAVAVCTKDNTVGLKETQFSSLGVLGCRLQKQSSWARVKVWPGLCATGGSSEESISLLFPAPGQAAQLLGSWCLSPRPRLLLSVSVSDHPASPF